MPQLLEQAATYLKDFIPLDEAIQRTFEDVDVSVVPLTQRYLSIVDSPIFAEVCALGSIHRGIAIPPEVIKACLRAPGTDFFSIKDSLSIWNEQVKAGTQTKETKLKEFYMDKVIETMRGKADDTPEGQRIKALFLASVIDYHSLSKV